MKEKLFVSACMLGACCRYDGKSKPIIEIEKLELLLEKYEIIPICPEIYGGLPTPRNPSEIVGDRVVMNDGSDVTENYRRGASCLLELSKKLGVRLALLKERSPSCGLNFVYDGSFSGRLREGSGIFASLLLNSGAEVFTEYEIDSLLEKK